MQRIFKATQHMFCACEGLWWRIDRWFAKNKDISSVWADAHYSADVLLMRHEKTLEDVWMSNLKY
ncbi:hypothetical protein ACQZ5N_10895 [Agrobacterium sp. 22-221-1]|jgi:hypothetical protein|uniref:hypothetical protein n=1 Tax=Agrobacterium TaxID=357 RepID=UPI0009BC0509|nr:MULTISPECIES: hypothetical protein [Agrobacterium]UXT44485.1 hypothetical protein FY137_25180 [Agrobacterium tumefaciens]WFS69283.1 hypothetical protein CFBP4996_25225 [Agrobacterium leguminum]